MLKLYGKSHTTVAELRRCDLREPPDWCCIGGGIFQGSLMAGISSSSFLLKTFQKNTIKPTWIWKKTYYNIIWWRKWRNGQTYDRRIRAIITKKQLWLHTAHWFFHTTVYEINWRSYHSTLCKIFWWAKLLLKIVLIWNWYRESVNGL